MIDIFQCRVLHAFIYGGTQWPPESKFKNTFKNVFYKYKRYPGHRKFFYNEKLFLESETISKINIHNVAFNQHSIYIAICNRLTTSGFRCIGLYSFRAYIVFTKIVECLYHAAYHRHAVPRCALSVVVSLLPQRSVYSMRDQ